MIAVPYGHQDEELNNITIYEEEDLIYYAEATIGSFGQVQRRAILLKQRGQG